MTSLTTSVPDAVSNVETITKVITTTVAAAAVRHILDV